MEKRLSELLENKGGNYILPFFWQHGEEEQLLCEGMEKIYASGIGAVCVESRPHPDFVGEKWWRDMDIIMKEARQKNMKVWVLDDAHFPSGYANGQVENHPSVGKRFLDHYSIDVVGPMKFSSFIVKLETEEQLVGVVVGLRDRFDAGKLSQLQDVTHLVKDGMLYWDVPEGLWCVNIIKTTTKSSCRPNYINVIDKEAVRFFIDTVYEPHFLHYKEEFGHTFAGFFSDEPEIGNVGGGDYGHEAYIGQRDMVLPWCKELEDMLKVRWKKKYVINLIGLWHNIENISPAARLFFMDCLTQLYNQNFCTQIGDWCRDHGVEYIGHVIEDGGTHARLGLGTGHFFRALWGQDMSGIDVVLQQIRPGLDDTPFFRIGGKQFYHGEFFHYGLAKMGASLGHMDKKKQGRTMCEMYGAYGWAEGLKLMKWLTDHMLVRGINHFVPHAFTMKDFPDQDCPPHFYARGMNPQYPYFKYLMNYINRISHLINGGLHIPNVAVLYHAEAEWAGEYQPFEKVGRVLARNQIDFEVAPIDIIMQSQVTDGQLIVGEEPCKALIIPKSKFLPAYFMEWCQQAESRGLTILCIGDIPTGINNPNEASTYINNLKSITLEDMVPYLRQIGAYEILLTKAAPDLRYYHYKQPKGDYYLFFNESPNQTVSTTVKIPGNYEMIYQYDAFDNKLMPAECNNRELVLNLSPYEAYIAYIGPIEEQKLCANSRLKNYTEMEIKGPWTVTMWETGREKETKEIKELTELVNLTDAEEKPYFAGVMEYETIFHITDKTEEAELDFGEVFETLEVWINGKNAGVRIAPPYRVNIGNLIKQGENHLKVLVVNTLVHSQRDRFSITLPIEPSGLLGPVVLFKKEG